MRSRPRNEAAPRNAALYVVAAILLWPLIELLGARLGARHSAFQTVWLRYAVHIAMLLGLCAVRCRLQAFRAQRPVLQLLRGVMMFVMPVMFVLAVSAGSLPFTWTVFWIVPVFVLVAAPLVAEVPTRVQWAAAIFGWFGAALVFNATPAVTTVLPALAMASSFAAYLVMSRALRHEPLPASLLFTGIGAIAPMTVLALPEWTPLVMADVFPLLAIGAASLLFLASVDRTVEAAPVAAIAPLFTGVVVVEAVQRRLTGEPIRTIELGGLAMILASVALLRPLQALDQPAILTQDS